MSLIQIPFWKETQDLVVHDFDGRVSLKRVEASRVGYYIKEGQTQNLHDARERLSITPIDQGRMNGLSRSNRINGWQSFSD